MIYKTNAWTTIINDTNKRVGIKFNKVGMIKGSIMPYILYNIVIKPMLTGFSVGLL